MLYDKLKKYTASGVYPMHMPGHKRNPAYMPSGLSSDIDITEIHGFDDLRDPQGVLRETKKLAAELYGSSEAFPLVGGSTLGILTAIGAHAQRGSKILADGFCHHSIPNAAELFGLELLRVVPETDEESGVPCAIPPFLVEAALKKDPDIRLVVITSPTYEGVVSDISEISKVVHSAGALLLVDCAHGAHLGFSDAFPKSPVMLGADMVVVSLHKTLPALTQCSLLHLCGERADINQVQKMLNILQTSSPSYVLMSSIDHCLRLLRENAPMLFRDYENSLLRFTALTSKLKNFSVLKKRPDFFDFDLGKIVIVTKNAAMSGTELADVLREDYKIELERACYDYAIAMTSICDSYDGFTRFADALIAVDMR